MADVIRSFNQLAHTFHPAVFPWRKLLAALALGWCGGYAFYSANLPLPWMLGSMTVLTIASLFRAPLAAPGAIRPPMTAIIGVMLGSSFKPEIFDHVYLWIPTLAGLIVFVLVSGAACVWYFHRIAGFDPATAFFSGMPGGLMEMIELGEEKGADHRVIALIHSARILLIVFCLPFLVRWMEGLSFGTRAPQGISVFVTPWLTLALLLACAIGGAWLGKRLKLPASTMMGPMLVSAALHLSGVTDFVPPREIISAAQLVLGTVLGCRFVGTPPAEVFRILKVSIGSTAILIAVTVAFAALVGHITGYGLVPLILAYSPGGLAEMSLLALSLHAEVAFVAAHHIARILLVMTSAGTVFRLIGLDRPAPAVFDGGQEPAE